MNSLDWKFISEVKKNIEKNIDNTDFCVDKLCELQGVSRTSLYSKLKALTGQSPTALIRVTRLKYAARLLKEGEHNIGEIADMSGFSETKYFREVFKKYYRMSPSTYAKEGKSLSSVVVVEDEPEEEEATDWFICESDT